MRLMPRMLASLAMAGGLTILLASGAIHAAPGHGKPAAGTHRVNTARAQRVNKDTQSQVSFSLDQIASVVGVSTAVLQQDLQAGQTLLQIAGSKYNSASDLATALLANVKIKLDRAAAGGQLTATQESQIYAQMLSDAETLVVTPHPQLASANKASMDSGVNIKATLIATIAASCHTTTDALMTVLGSGGKNLLTACQTTSPSATVDSLAAAVTAAVKAQLDAAVSAGTITASQENQTLGDLQAHLNGILTMPVNTSVTGGGGKSVQTSTSFSLDQIAAVEGVSTAVLQQDLQAGQTLLQIAGSKYSSANELATALLAGLKTKLDHAVALGKLTADQESQIYGKLLSDAETLVVTPHPQLASGDTGQKDGFGIVKPAIFSTLVTSCNTTVEALSNALQAGDKSVLAACQVTNPSATEESLATAITAAVRTQLDADVSSGQITAERESALLAQLQANLSDMLTTPAGAHHTDKKA